MMLQEKEPDQLGHVHRRKLQLKQLGISIVSLTYRTPAGVQCALPLNDPITITGYASTSTG